MTSPSRWSAVAMLTLLALVSTSFLVFAADPPQHAAVSPVPRFDNWARRYFSFNERAKQGDVDLLFVGDSITQGWEAAGKAIWEKHYASRKPMNIGIGGDRTEHVLWRLDNGNIEGIRPKLAVVMIGTNNSRANTAEEIADGITAVVNRLREKSPDTKILLLGIFPRGEKAWDPQRLTNVRASGLASKLADDKVVFYLDIGHKFLQPDGTLPRDIMPDVLHPNEKGYEIWAEAIEPKVAELLGESK